MKQSCGCAQQPCGCCSGTSALTPVAHVNRPGLSALAYRAGIYGSFYETMLARLTSLYLDVPSSSGTGATDRIYPLRRLTTREPTDPAIALLDAFAVVGDVLTFYQERIANEGYLPTALERRSVLELGKLVGYRLRPGVSASVYLAFTVATAFTGDIPVGTRAQSIPGAGETAQFFETSETLTASDAWNSLKARLARAQPILLDGPTGIAPWSVRTLYFTGLTSNLRPGDGILITLSDTAPQNQTGESRVQKLRLTHEVTPQPDAQRTLVTLVPATTSVAGTDAFQTLTTTLQPYIDQTSNLFPGSDLAARVGTALTNLLGALTDQSSWSDALTSLEAILPQIQTFAAIAETRNFTRIRAWMGDLMADLSALDGILAAAAGETGATGTGTLAPGPLTSPRAPEGTPLTLTRLGSILDRLEAPPLPQPANSIQLARSVATSFAADQDTAPRLLATLRPAAAELLYSAWQQYQPAPSPLRVLAMRVKAALFASNFSGQTTYSPTSGQTSYMQPTLQNTWNALGVTDMTRPNAVALDAAYDQIKVRSWVAIDRPVFDSSNNETGRKVTYHVVRSVRTQNLAALDGGLDPVGYTAKSTMLTLDPPWLSDVATAALEPIVNKAALLSETVVYAQAEALALAEEPYDRDVEGDSIELDALYQGIEPGKWVIVSGARTDIPNVSGAISSELVMIAGVTQSAQNNEPVHTTITLANKLAYTYDTASVTIFANVVKATHGQTVGEVLGDGDASRPFLTFTLHQQPLTYRPAATPAGAASTLETTVNDLTWNEVDDLAGAGPADHVYVTSADDANVTSIRFGNGTHGARTPTGTANLKATYRYGIGKAGNVSAQQISQIATHPLGLQGVINPLAASGGADADDRDSARRNTPIAVMALDRLVSVRDYADFARNYAGVGKATAVRLSDGIRQVVHVTIAGAEDIPIDVNSDLYGNLLQSLLLYGDPSQPIVVCPRMVKLIVISARVKLLAGYHWEAVEPQIRAALLDAFSFDNRSLGQTAFLSEAVSLIQRIEGVSYVDPQTFDSVAQGISIDALALLSTGLKLQPYVLAELARPNPDAPVTAAPCERILPAELAYVTPDIPATVILIQVS